MVKLKSLKLYIGSNMVRDETIYDDNIKLIAIPAISGKYVWIEYKSGKYERINLDRYDSIIYEEKE